PRDENNDGRIVQNEGDVGPDSYLTGTVMPFEFFEPVAEWSSAGPTVDLAPLTAGTDDWQYAAAWGPGVDPALRPRLLRITIGMQDGNDRLTDEKVSQFVIEVP